LPSGELLTLAGASSTANTSSVARDARSLSWPSSFRLESPWPQRKCRRSRCLRVNETLSACGLENLPIAAIDDTCPAVAEGVLPRVRVVAPRAATSPDWNVYLRRAKPKATVYPPKVRIARDAVTSWQIHARPAATDGVERGMNHTISRGSPDGHSSPQRLAGGFWRQLDCA
jgi:hypothetical protein